MNELVQPDNLTTNSTLNYLQSILKIQNPGSSGLAPIKLGALLARHPQPKGDTPTVQILHLGANHWICAIASSPASRIIILDSDPAYTKGVHSRTLPNTN
jgi:hypothetical protein